MRTSFRSPSTRHRRTAVRAAALCAIMVLAATACGASADVEVVAQSPANNTSAQTTADTATDVDAAESAGESDEGGATEAATNDAAAEETESDADSGSEDLPGPLSLVDGAFELVLEDGTSYSAPIQCVLQPQLAAGSEILFTAGGNHEGLFYDVTQWGETAFGGTQDVEITDATSFDSIWRSSGGSGLVLELNGNVISGSGGFYQGENFNGPYTQGELTVSC